MGNLVINIRQFPNQGELFTDRRSSQSYEFIITHFDRTKDQSKIEFIMTNLSNNFERIVSLDEFEKYFGLI
jgi:hypothetical protein